MTLPDPAARPARPLALDVLAGRLAVCRLDPGTPLADWMWAAGGAVSSVTRTEAELSVVCPERAVPAGVRAERGWRALRVRGPLPFDAVGVLASITAPLADAGVSIFSLSTFDTDVALVREGDLGAATAALSGAGHAVRRPAP